jgi:hypothetical protein
MPSLSIIQKATNPVEFVNDHYSNENNSSEILDVSGIPAAHQVMRSCLTSAFFIAYI